MSFDIDEFDEISNIKCPNFKFKGYNIVNNLSAQNYNKYDEENDENEEEEDDETKENELYKNFLKEDICEEDDEDISWNEDDNDDDEITQLDKQNDVLFLKETLNNISQKSPDEYNKINELLGENINLLKDIFTKEEEIQKNKKNNKNK